MSKHNFSNQKVKEFQIKQNRPKFEFLGRAVQVKEWFDRDSVIARDKIVQQREQFHWGCNSVIHWIIKYEKLLYSPFVFIIQWVNTLSEYREQ